MTDVKAIIIGTIIALLMAAFLFFNFCGEKAAPETENVKTYTIMDEQNNTVGHIILRGN